MACEKEEEGVSGERYKPSMPALTRLKAYYRHIGLSGKDLSDRIAGERSKHGSLSDTVLSIYQEDVPKGWKPADELPSKKEG